MHPREEQEMLGAWREVHITTWKEEWDTLLLDETLSLSKLLLLII